MSRRGENESGAAPRPLRSYDVATERFGTIRINAHDIKDARRDARERLGVTNPADVTAVREYNTCDRCDSAPCCCGTPGARVLFRAPDEVARAVGARISLHVAPLLRCGDRTPQQLLIDVTLTGRCSIAAGGGIYAVEIVIGHDARGEQRIAWANPSSLVELDEQPFDYTTYEWVQS